MMKTLLVDVLGPGGLPSLGAAACRLYIMDDAVACAKTISEIPKLRRRLLAALNVTSESVSIRDLLRYQNHMVKAHSVFRTLFLF